MIRDYYTIQAAKNLPLRVYYFSEGFKACLETTTPFRQLGICPLEFTTLVKDSRHA